MTTKRKLWFKAIDEARVENDAARDWLLKNRGQDQEQLYVREMQELIDELLEFPDRFPAYGVGGLRRSRPVYHGKYRIYYVVRKPHLIAVAVAHHAKLPNYWISRVY